MRKFRINASKTAPTVGDIKFIGQSWEELISDLKAAGYTVIKTKNHWLYLEKDGEDYEAEVTNYYPGGYEILKYNINKTGVTASKSIKSSLISARTISRWNHRINEYEPVDVPDNWNVSQFTDMDEEVNCVNCGKPLPFGESYTSRRYHDKFGFGYAECPECYEEQLQDEFGNPSAIESTTNITAADDIDDFEDPRNEELEELQDRVSDDFDYVISGIERLQREGLLDEAISLLNTLSDTLDSAIGIIGNDFETGSAPEEEI